MPSWGPSLRSGGCGDPWTISSAPLYHSLRKTLFSLWLPAATAIWLAAVSLPLISVFILPVRPERHRVLCGSLKSCGDSWATASLPTEKLPGLSLPLSAGKPSWATHLCFRVILPYTAVASTLVAFSPFHPHRSCSSFLDSSAQEAPDCSWSGSTLFALKPDSLPREDVR